MKKLFFLWLILNPILLFSQNEDLTEQFIKDLLKEERPTNKGQTVKVKTSLSRNWVKNFATDFKENENATFIKIQRESLKYDTIVLSKVETRQIRRYLRKKKSLNWDKLALKDYGFTAEKDWDVLTLEWDKFAYLEISNPIFIRNNTIAICSEVYLCDGTCGYKYFGFYKLIDGKWKQWIPVSNGYF